MPLRIFVIFLLSVCSSAAPIKVACIGDSITQGGSLSVQETYPGRLQRLLGTNYNVQNYGVSGRTLLKRGDFPYWNDAAFSQSRAFNPDIVIIQLGTNDGKPYNWIYGTNFLSDYRELIQAYSALPGGPRIFLCAPCPVFGNGAFDIVPGVVRTNIAPAVRSLAAELSLPLIDLHSRMTNAAWFPDTVHPDSTGYAVMAAVMFENVTGGLPAEEPPTLAMRRETSTRVVLSWPAKWGALVPQTTLLLRTNGAPWTILQAAQPYSDGVTLRQTNIVGGLVQRYFQLARP
jgi:acyl-CoA thioesterase I